MSTSPGMQVADSVALASSGRPARLLRRLLLLAGFVVLSWLVSGTGQASAADSSAATVRQQAGGSDPMRPLTAVVEPTSRVPDLVSDPVGVVGRSVARIPVEREIDIAPTMLSSLLVAQPTHDTAVVSRPVIELLTPVSRVLDTVVGYRKLAHGLGSAVIRSAQAPTMKLASIAFSNPGSLEIPHWMTPTRSGIRNNFPGSPYDVSISGLSYPAVPGTPSSSNCCAWDAQDVAGGHFMLVYRHSASRFVAVGYGTVSPSTAVNRQWFVQPGSSPD